MSQTTRRQFVALAAGAYAGFGRAADTPAKGLVTGQPEGAAAGTAVLADGGNAVDAIVTAALVSGVVAAASTGIAGYGGCAVVARPDGGTSAFDLNGTAPAAATPDMYAADENGVVKGNVNAHGWKAAGVPGILGGLQLMLDRAGTRKFSDLVKPAVRYAKDGFAVSRTLAAGIKSARPRFAADPASARLYLKDGEPLAEKATCRNPDLAVMLQTLADRGRVDTFYKGDIADAIAAAFRKNGGLVTAADLAAYKASEAAPLSLAWNDFILFTPAPTGGGLTVLQVIRTLQLLGWARGKYPEPLAAQARLEALRLAWHDRLALLGDPQFVKVPVVDLLSLGRAKAAADKVRAALKAGKPLEGKSDGRPAGGTIHLNAVDAAGMSVALTLTHGGYFGAQVTIDGLGLTLGHGMSRFDPRPGRANSVGPGKRPLHNMCPVVATRGGKPVLAVGATGGRRIPNTVCDVLTYRIGEGRTLAEAADGPRMHTDGDPAVILEPRWPDAVRDHLKAVGYAVTAGPGANLNAIERDPATGTVAPAAR